MTLYYKNSIPNALSELLKARQNGIRLKNESIFARFLK